MVEDNHDKLLSTSHAKARICLGSKGAISSILQLKYRKMAVSGGKDVGIQIFCFCADVMH